MKTTRNRPEDAVALTQEEAEIIAEDCGVSAGECWICEMFVEKLRKDKDGFYLLPEALEDYGLVEHLRQIIGRDVDEEPLAQSQMKGAMKWLLSHCVKAAAKLFGSQRPGT